MKAWCENKELESDTIRYVEKKTSIPFPNIIYSWIDTEWNRTFLILKPVVGRTLRQAWRSLSLAQRRQIARAVARFCKVLASYTAPRLESAFGSGVLDSHLTVVRVFSEPSWKPQLLGPFSIKELFSYLSIDKAGLPPYSIDKFHYYHADLGPTNILVSDDGNINGIIDWESAAFYPKFWVATKPLVSAGFFLEGTDYIEKREWSTFLADALQEEGFTSGLEAWSIWKRALGNE